MFYSLYCIFDAKAKLYSSPFMAENDEVAIRQFKYQCIRPDSPYLADPDSFVLYRVGTFNTADLDQAHFDGCIELFSGKEFING